MDVEETVILRVSSRVESSRRPSSPFRRLTRAREELASYVDAYAVQTAWNGVLGCNYESSSFGERLRENMEVAHTRRGREAAMLSSPDDPRDPACSRRTRGNS
jgi:hypothetical protein